MRKIFVTILSVFMLIMIAQTFETKTVSAYSTDIQGLTWVMRDSYIDVGVAYTSTDPNVRIRWQEYDVNKGSWRIISDWSTGNWASWFSNCGDYWLHCEIMTSDGNITAKTIAFHYVAGETQISGTYFDFTAEEDNTVLLGMASTKTSGVKYSFNLYNVNDQSWSYITHMTDSNWIKWGAKTGSYWINYELYTSDGRLADYRTYGFSSIEAERRALFLGETSTNEVPIEDITNMNGMMAATSFYGKCFNSRAMYPDKKKAKIINKISSCFSNTTENDVSYLYITCHGEKSGGVKLEPGQVTFTPRELRDIIDTYIEGYVIVMIDACYSGQFIGRSTDQSEYDSDALEFANNFMDKFFYDDNNTMNSRSSNNLVSNRIKVICSSTQTETSLTSYPVSFATKRWLTGSGWNPFSQSMQGMLADTNSDNKVSLKELYTYSYNEVNSVSGGRMHIVCSSPDDEFVIFGRY